MRIENTLSYRTALPFLFHMAPHQAFLGSVGKEPNEIYLLPDRQDSFSIDEFHNSILILKMELFLFVCIGNHSYSFTGVSIDWKSIRNFLCNDHTDPMSNFDGN